MFFINTIYGFFRKEFDNRRANISTPSIIFAFFSFIDRRIHYSSDLESTDTNLMGLPIYSNLKSCASSTIFHHLYNSIFPLLVFSINSIYFTTVTRINN